MAIPKINIQKKRRRSGIIYHLDFRVNGKRFRESVGTSRQQAELIRVQRINEIINGKYNLPGAEPSRVSLDSLIEEFKKDKKRTTRDVTQSRYKNYLNPLGKFFKELFPVLSADVSLIKATHVNEFLDQVTDKSSEDTPTWSRRTANDAIKIFRALFRFAQNSGYLKINPLEKVKPFREAAKGKTDYFRQDQLENIWGAVDPHWKDALEFICHTGLRKGELINLRWKSVDLTPNDERITVESYDDWETKTGKTRIVPLNSSAVAIIRRQQGRHPDFVFTSKEGNQIHPDKIYHALKSALLEIGLEGDVHKLRHTFASQLNINGIDLVSIKDLLGHSDLATTQRYAHVSPKHLRTAVEVLARVKVVKS